ncbi:MAG TPA: hypothetical protein VNW04_12355, partial [Puia sp.]|nr:hypothetical protein [Puia sp.]
MFETFIDAMGMERPAERPDDRFVLSGEMTPGLERLFAECGGGDENRIYVFDCATMEVLYFDQHVIDYHTITLVEDREDQFAASLYFELLEYLGLPGLPFDKCLGYTRPLFLSGNNDPDNYELIDMEVNWSISCQIYEQIKDLPDGT